MRQSALRTVAVALTLALAGPAWAQLPGGLGLPGGILPGGGASPLPGPLSDVEPATRLNRTLQDGLDPAEGSLAAARSLATGVVSELRRRTADQLLRRHGDVVEADDQGQPVVRGEVLALAPSPAALARAKAAGFQTRRRTDLDALGLQAVVLAPPRGMSAPEAVRRLRDLDPQGTYDFNHLFQAGGAAGPAAAPAGPGGAAPAPGGRLGLVDGSPATRHPALRGAKVTGRAFAPGGARVTAHATAVASLMVGDGGRFRGGAPRASLLVADVYGPTPTGGSAEAIVRGLAWLAQNRVWVVNISLVGPPNRLLQAAVAAMVAKGHVLVAAVGNDGPSAPPLYPASYPGVVAVTAVDGGRRILPEAGRGTHVDFAAPGADMAAAAPGGGYVAVRGTSFAAPLVAGMIARQTPWTSAPAAVEALGRGALDLGAPGNDRVYGRGLVAAELRTEPGRVGAQAAALRGP